MKWVCVLCARTAFEASHFFNRGVFVRTDSEYWFSMDSKRNYRDQFFTGFSDQCGRVNFGCENMCLGQSTEQKSKAGKNLCSV